MDSMAGLPRNASVEELALSMFGAGAAGFRLGRTPSEAEFTQFLSAGGLAPGGDGDMPGAGMHRVASIDLLRRMVLSQQAAISQAAAAGDAQGDAGHTPVATGLSGAALAGGACLAGRRPPTARWRAPITRCLWRRAASPDRRAGRWPRPMSIAKRSTISPVRWGFI